MNWHKFSPAILTLLVFLLAQGLEMVLILGVGILTSPEFSAAFQSFCRGEELQSLPLYEVLSISYFSLILMAVNILAVLCCYFLMHNIHFAATFDFSAIRWCPGMLAVVGGFLGALSISIITDAMELPDVMLQISLAMSHNICGLFALVIVGPITEELLFREAIAGEMLRRGASPWVAIIVSALAFSIVHLNFDQGLYFAQGLYALPLGIIFGIIYYKTGNIVLTSLLHIFNNGIVVAQLYTMNEDIANLSLLEWFGDPLKAYAAMLFLGLLCIAVMKLFWDCYLPLQRNKRKSVPY